MDSVLALQAMPESTGGPAVYGDAMITTLGSYVSVFNECTGERSVWCTIACNAA